MSKEMTQIIRQWIDSVYVAMIEVTGSGAYQYDTKIMTDSLDELSKEMKEKEKEKSNA